ncbi:MAG: DUF1329 domain-containing protein [Pseudomonadota bacterium]
MNPGKYNRAYTRRSLLSGIGGLTLTSCGVLNPLWRTLAHAGDDTAAYPEHLLSLTEYTKGKVSEGDEIDSDNVEHVADLLDPIRLQQVSMLGRRLKTRVPTRAIEYLMPGPYLEATLRNQGQAYFDEKMNVRASGGEPWIGGNPFPDPKTALEVFAGHTLSWGRHDASLYTAKEFDVGRNGKVKYRYESVWAEYAPVGRTVLEPRPARPDMRDKLRYQSIIFTAPNDFKGTSFLNVWPYDQRQFPDLKGYIPAFKRIRSFPTNQRFEPLIPGSSLYLSDAWAAGDPFLTWGDYRVVHRGPALASISGNWEHQHSNWEHSTHGPDGGERWWDMQVELIPEAIVVEAKPTGFPRAPISKKQVWFDARTLLPFVMVSFDRRGDVFRSFDGAYSRYEAGDNRVMDGGLPYWSWTHLHAHNVQTHEITRIEQVASLRGGHRMLVDDEAIFSRYLTTHAMRRFGN